MQSYAFLVTTQLHNPCLLYWVSHAEYTRVLTLCDFKFCRYHSPCAWILLCSQPLTGSRVVKDLVFRRYMDVAHTCSCYHELCYDKRLLLDFDVDCKVWQSDELSVWTKTCKLWCFELVMWSYALLWCILSLELILKRSCYVRSWGPRCWFA